jgi:CRP/FNR family cyclic AMP-dependent transcriptional regulator
MILRDLTKGEMAVVEQLGHPHQVTRGEWIVREGDVGQSFFLVISGRVEVRKSLGADKYKKLVELGPLDIFGEVCFLGVETRSAGVMALDPTLVMEFGRAEFEKLIEVHPAIGLKLYRGIACELAQRLARVDSELKDALVWALGDTRTSMDPGVISARKLNLAPLPASGGNARIVFE